MDEILKGMKEVAEGVFTAKAVKQLIEKFKLNLPILSVVNDMIDGKRSAKEALIELMSLPIKTEFEYT